MQIQRELPLHWPVRPEVPATTDVGPVPATVERPWEGDRGPKPTNPSTLQTGYRQLDLEDWLSEPSLHAREWVFT